MYFHNVEISVGGNVPFGRPSCPTYRPTDTGSSARTASDRFSLVKFEPPKGTVELGRSR